MAEQLTVVMIVDDDSLFSDIISHRLEKEGMTCIYAPKGSVALEMIQNGAKPAVILLDVTMPGMDGFEVLRRLKAAAASIPVIMFSNDFSDENVQKSKALGAALFLEKVQVTPGAVVDAIRAHATPA